MGGKQSQPAAPDYTAIAQADSTAANNQYALGQQQLSWAQQQFASTWPYAQQYLQSQTAATTANQAEAGVQQSYYDKTYQPIETQFAQTASNYNSPTRAAANAGGAMADVASTFDANRAASQSSLESYGIDPSQTRYAALDLGTRISQAAATAAASTQSNLNTQATGLALQGEAINVGRGYSNAIAQSYNTATNAGAAGINAANSTTSTGANTMGTATQYQGLGNQSMSNAGSNAAAQGQYGLGVTNANNQAASNTMSGIGSLVGAAGMMMMM